METLEEEYKRKYDIGFPMFKKLFDLKKDDFIIVMKDIFQGNESVFEILENKPSVIKKLRDDEPQEIKIHFYSSIEINHLGIYYKPEHGNSVLVLKFDKFLNLDEAFLTLVKK